jgi:anti-sigma factor RsiW
MSTRDIPHRDIPQSDQLLLQRFLDDQMDPAARAAFASRMAAEPELHRAADAARSLRSGFVAAQKLDVRSPSPAFLANVMTAVQRLPTREQLERADIAASAIRLCRRMLLAAAILAVLGGLWYSGLVRPTAAPALQADSSDVQREVECLDALLETGAVPPPASRAKHPANK